MTCSSCSGLVPSDKMSAMFASLRHFIGWVISAFCSRQELILENLALRQQLLALHAKRPRRRLSARQKLFWIVLRKLWQGWKKPLILVTLRTVVEWHRAGFRLYWKCVTRHIQKRTSNDVRPRSSGPSTGIMVHYFSRAGCACQAH